MGDAADNALNYFIDRNFAGTRSGRFTKSKPSTKSLGFVQSHTPGRWKDAEGVVHRMADMDSSYIVNCMYGCINRKNYVKWDEFYSELETRGDQEMAPIWNDGEANVG